MTPSEIGNLVATIGFPSAAAWITWVFAKARVEAAEKSAERREEASVVREDKMNERLTHLEATMRSELIALVNKCMEVMGDTKDTMEYCSATLKACTVALEDLADTQKKLQKVG